MNRKAEQIKAFLTSYGMDYTQVDMESCSADYISEMENGLQGRKRKESSLEMIPTFLETLREVPTGKSVIAMDAGGTNFRIASVRFDASGQPSIENFRRFTMPGFDRELGAADFFGELGAALKTYLPESGRIGFCFSYPLQMLPSHDGRLIKFTKEIRAKEVEGKLIGRELNRAIATEAGGKAKKIVLLNDTVAALLAGMSAAKGRRYDSYIGFILGTGMNCSYIESNENITKEQGLKAGRSQIINIESGAFGKAPRGRLDLVFDEQTDSPGKYTYEKMISGGYLGQMMLTVLRQAARDGLFSAETSQNITRCTSLNTQEVNDFLSFPEASGTISGWIREDREADRQLIFLILMRLIERAGKFAAITLSSIIRKTGTGKNPCYPVCITAEGTTFYKLRFLKESIQYFMKEFLVDASGAYYEFVSVDNAPLIGAAIAGLMTG